MNWKERQGKIRSPGQAGRCTGRQKIHRAKGRCHEEPYSPRHSHNQDCHTLLCHFSLDNTMKTEALVDFSFPPSSKKTWLPVWSCSTPINNPCRRHSHPLCLQQPSLCPGGNHPTAFCHPRQTLGSQGQAHEACLQKAPLQNKSKSPSTCLTSSKPLLA